MKPIELSNPATMEGSAAMASSSFPASRMNNGSIANQADESQNYQSNYSPSLQSGVGMNFQRTVHASFNQGYQVHSNIQRFHHTSQPQLTETYQIRCSIPHSDPLHSPMFQSSVPDQSLTDLMNSPQVQSNAAGQSQTDLTNSVQSDSLLHPQPRSQLQLIETSQNPTLIYHSNSQHSPQFQSNVAGHGQTDLTNSRQNYILEHPQPTSQPQLNETRQNQTLTHHSNSQHTGQFQSNVPGQSQTDQKNSVQSDSLVHPQPTNQPQLNHGYSSQDSQQKRTRRPKAANEEERQERKKESDKKYKEKMKQQKIEIYAENENLKRNNVILASQKQWLSDIIIQMQPNAQIPAHMRSSSDCGQQRNEQIPAQMGQLDTQQIHHPSFSAPVAGFPRSHHGEDSEEFDQDPEVSELLMESNLLRMERNRLASEVQLLQGSTSCQQSNEQTPLTCQRLLHSDCSAQQQLNGSQFSNDVQDPPWTYSSSHGGGIASRSNPTEKQDNSRAHMARILETIGEKRKSKVTYSDFEGLNMKELVPVGEYNFPKSLKSTVENITNKYGDVSKNSTMPQCVDEPIYILFCATIKEMDDLQLPKVTENCIIKWSDTIKAALEIKFNVGFAMEHLKNNIIPAFVGQIHCQRVDEMKEKISNLEASLNALKQDHDKECKQSKVYKDAMDKFNGKSVSSGLFM